MLSGVEEQADLAFTEANVLDPELPEPWGWLALLAARYVQAFCSNCHLDDDWAEVLLLLCRSRRWLDCSRALDQGRRVGLDDASILADVSATYEETGRLTEAADVLKWAASSPPFHVEVGR